MQIFVKTRRQGYEGIIVEAEPWNTIGDLKIKIQQKNGIPSHEHRLIFNNERLKDGETLAHYNISNKSMILFLRHVKGSLKMFVQTATGKTITLMVKSSDFIDYIKALIWNKEGTPPDQQCLMVGEMQLENDKIVGDYSIDWETAVVDLLVRSKGVISISVKTVKGKTISLEVKGSDRIEYVKRKIEDKEGVPTYYQRLIFGDTELDDRRNVDAYNIKKDSIILLLLYPEYIDPAITLHIRFKTLTGRIIRLEVRSCDTIRDVKTKLEDIHGFPAVNVRLSFDGEHLDDKWTVAACYIQNESIVNLNVRMIGS